ncbi:hypothetical protein SK128_025338, partial [Halocaridina rubra]
LSGKQLKRQSPGRRRSAWKRKCAGKNSCLWATFRLLTAPQKRPLRVCHLVKEWVLLHMLYMTIRL